MTHLHTFQTVKSLKVLSLNVNKFIYCSSASSAVEMHRLLTYSPPVSTEHSYILSNDFIGAYSTLLHYSTCNTVVE